MDTREALMQATAELMQEVGYHLTTTAAVAKRAGVSEGAIYRHFPSKEALAQAVFADIWRIFNEYLETHLPPREQPVERLESFLPLTLEALSALMPRYGTLAQQEHLYFAAKHDKAGGLPAGCRQYIALLEETIRLAQGVGRVRPEVDAAIAAHFFFFGAHQVIELYGDPHSPQPPAGERLPRHVFEQLFSLMRHALYGGNA